MSITPSSYQFKNVAILTRNIEFENSRLMETASLDNLTLSENNVRHIIFELNNDKPDYPRIARETHQLLYRLMIESIKSSHNYFTLIQDQDYPGPFKNEDSEGNITYWKGEKIKSCKKAWCYVHAKQEDFDIAVEKAKKKKKKKDSNDRIIIFYTALAFVQAPFVMKQLVHSKTLKIEVEDIRTLEWLHEFRNTYEHFLTNYTYKCSIEKLKNASRTALDISTKLIECGNIIPYRKTTIYEDIKSIAV